MTRMSAAGKQAQRATKVTEAVHERKKAAPALASANQPVMVLDLISRTIQSVLLPTNKACALFGQDGGLQAYRAEFVFQADLREYVHLQGLASAENRKLSSIISFTSARSNVDALALPTSQYVRDTWKQDGARLLQMIEKALIDTKNQGIPGRKSSLVSRS